MIVLRALSIVAVCCSLTEYAHAQDKLKGCWENIGQVSVDPKFSPTHESTTASGYIVCFKENRAITTVSIGGFEALSSSGRYTYRAGHLTVSENEIADGWIFAHKNDRCDLSLYSNKLQISKCEEWKNSRLEVFRRQKGVPDLNGVAAGVFQ